MTLKVKTNGGTGFVDEIEFVDSNVATAKRTGRRVRVRFRRLGRATTTTPGLVRLAADGEATAGEAVQANDSRLLTRVVATSDASDSTIAAPTEHTELTFPVVDGGLYQFRFFVIYQSAATTTGLALGVRTPGGAGEQLCANVSTPLGGSSGTDQMWTGSSRVSSGLVTATSTQAANVRMLATIEGIVLVDNDGNVNLTFGTEVDGSAVTVKAGSFVEYRRLA